MVTKLLNSYCGAHFVESYCKESNISETKISFFIIVEQNLSVWHHLLDDLHMLKTWISLEQRYFDNSKLHFSSHAGCLFVFYDDLIDRKDAIFVRVPSLSWVGVGVYHLILLFFYTSLLSLFYFKNSDHIPYSLIHMKNTRFWLAESSAVLV